jgi:hypothetical protein
MAVTDEIAPKKDTIKVGVELEGVGTVRTTWTKAASGLKHLNEGVYKHTPLVRSKSFSETRGVAIHAEQLGGNNPYVSGHTAPAELVSSPHVFNTEQLLNLGLSVRKMMSNAGVKTGKPTYSESESEKTELESRFAKNRSSVVGGNLQTTIGVNTIKLLSDSHETRSAVVNFLVGDKEKKTVHGSLVRGCSWWRLRG